MKKLIIGAFLAAALFLLADTAYYRLGVYIDLNPDQPITSFVKTQGDKILLDAGDGYYEFEIKGVNLGSGEPGQWATDFHIDKETYLRWFRWIQEMGANTIRIYTVQSDTFYNAFYEYNRSNPEPLYLLHGVWVNDYVQNSHRDAYDSDFYEEFLKNCRTMLDVIHGNKKISLGRNASAGHGTYRKDISPWVIGYILGVEWEDMTVAYTDDTYGGNPAYQGYEGRYLRTTAEATPFETMLCKVGEAVMSYESRRYKTQKLLAFSNWPTTDPFEYPEAVKRLYMKTAYVDMEHIKTTEDVITGQFASYHVYPYYPDYLNWTDEWSELGITDKTPFYDDQETLNTYRAYLSLLTAHHSMPVVISEFGVSTGRGMAHQDRNTGRNQGHMSEADQGRALAECYRDIKAVGCAGSCVFSWQDEWFKRTWNTMYAVDLTRTPYWSDYQTNEQYFGLLSFDPGKETSVCYVDGDVSEWSEADLAAENGELRLYMKYDERFVYLRIQKPGLDLSREKLYIPFDTTPKTGSRFCQNFNLNFDRPADFLLVLDGKENSRLMVQERYEALRSTYSQNLKKFDTYLQDNIPGRDSSEFVNIDMILEILSVQEMHLEEDLNLGDASFETGLLRYGNSNPESPRFDSLADFIWEGDNIEVRIPWQMLNFADPSRMEIHDDYYADNYGIAFLKIRSMYLGVTEGGEDSCPMAKVKLKGWGNKVTYHERLKSAYYVLQELWS